MNFIAKLLLLIIPYTPFTLLFYLGESEAMFGIDMNIYMLAVWISAVVVYIIYFVLVMRNSELSRDHKIGWAISLLYFVGLAQTIYWFMYINPIKEDQRLNPA